MFLVDRDVYGEFINENGFIKPSRLQMKINKLRKTKNHIYFVKDEIAFSWRIKAGGL